MKNIGAFFDFDETLLEVESARIGIQYLYDQKHVGLPFVLKILFYNLLETVGNPFAVEPTPQLARVAKQRRWPLLRYR